MYKRLNFIEREEISRHLAYGNSFQNIAKALKRTTSTISREVRLNAVHRRYYRALYGQQRANNIRRKKRRVRKLDQNQQLREIVFAYLRKKWAPEQIAQRLKILYPDDMLMRISHESIYSYLYVLPKGELKKRLLLALRKHHKARRKKKVSGNSKLGAIQNYLSIEERPQEVADRIIPGHWEGDMLVGKRNMTAIGTLVERTTRMTFLAKLNNLDAMTVRKSFEEEFRQLPKGLKRTLTYDQGPEMSEHRLFTKNTDITVYFAHPRSPWERGTNENTNALLRQYFPKGTDFSKLSKNKLKEVQDELNDRPRKTLGWFTPHEKFAELLR
jgi:transposase, IS30 family